MKSVYFNSSSETIKAKKLLAKNNIKTDIVKASDGVHGCVYALRFDDIYMYSVYSILSQNNYEYKRNIS